MEPPAQLALSAELDVDALVEREAHEVQGLADGHGVRLRGRRGSGGGGIFVGHRLLSSSVEENKRFDSLSARSGDRRYVRATGCAWHKTIVE